MIDPELKAELDILTRKIDAVHASAEKTRKYFLWTMILTLAFFVLPIIGIALVAPSFFSLYSGTLDSAALGM